MGKGAGARTETPRAARTRRKPSSGCPSVVYVCGLAEWAFHPTVAPVAVEERPWPCPPSWILSALVRRASEHHGGGTERRDHLVEPVGFTGQTPTWVQSAAKDVQRSKGATHSSHRCRPAQDVSNRTGTARSSPLMPMLHAHPAPLLQTLSLGGGACSGWWRWCRCCSSPGCSSSRCRVTRTFCIPECARRLLESVRAAGQSESCRCDTLAAEQGSIRPLMHWNRFHRQH